MNMNLKGIMNSLGAQPGQVVSDPFARAFAPAPVVKEETINEEDHEVSMAQKTLDDIIKNATELKAKIGEAETDLPAWIQDHISNSANYIDQAASGFYKNESINEEEIKWNAVENAIINFLKMNTKILDKRVKDRDTAGVKGGLKSIISGLTNAQRSLKLESINEVSYTVKAKNAYEFVNGAYSVLGAYLRDEKLDSSAKAALQRVVKDLEGLRKYFFSMKDESINEAFKHIISVETPTQVVSKPIAAQIEKLARQGVRASEIGLKMGFVGNQKAATDAFQKVKNQIYFKLNKSESVNEARLTDIVNSIIETPVIGKMVVNAPSTTQQVSEAKKYDVGAGFMGNGLTIWNRAEEEHGDYRIIAHIDPYGKISIRDKEIPSNVMNMIKDWAEAIKKGDK
jgi:hypothetical protein